MSSKISLPLIKILINSATISFFLFSLYMLIKEVCGVNFCMLGCSVLFLVAGFIVCFSKNPRFL